MSKDNGNGSFGTSFCGLLFIVFLVLKLCKVIEWSWWWVTSPLWIPLCIGVTAYVILRILARIEEHIKWKE